MDKVAVEARRSYIFELRICKRVFYLGEKKWRNNMDRRGKLASREFLEDYGNGA
jgi:hypothetical protein